MIELIQAYLKESFSKFLLDQNDDRPSNVPVIFLKSEGIVPVLKALKENPSIRLNFLNDLTAIDWLGKKSPRFEICYLLRSNNIANSLVRIKVPLDDGEKISSIVSVFKGANWPEREVFDLFGIEFINHPRMDRLIMPDNFLGHPLRKDYPLEGFGQDYLISDLLEIHIKDDITQDTK